MNRVVLEGDVTKKLLDAGERVAVCDAEGRVIGYFQPVGPQPMTPEMLQWAKEQISDEELERRSQKPGGITTEELLSRLKKL